MIIAFPGNLIDKEKMLGYFESYDGEEPHAFMLAYNEHDDFGDKYYFTPYSLGEGETLVFRMTVVEK